MSGRNEGTPTSGQEWAVECGLSRRRKTAVTGRRAHGGGNRADGCCNQRAAWPYCSTTLTRTSRTPQIRRAARRVARSRRAGLAGAEARVEIGEIVAGPTGGSEARRRAGSQSPRPRRGWIKVCAGWRFPAFRRSPRVPGDAAHGGLSAGASLHRGGCMRHVVADRGQAPLALWCAARSSIATPRELLAWPGLPCAICRPIHATG